MALFHKPSRKPRTRTAVLASVAAAATLGLTVPGAALAHHGDHGDHARAVPAPPANPTSADQIQNIDQVRTAIKGYYGDTTTDTPDPVDGSTMLHQFDPDGAYAHETEGIARRASRYLAMREHRAGHRHHAQPKPAILFDVDDTTLNTYSYEIYSKFLYNPTTNAAFVNAGSTDVFPAVPGMVRLENRAAQHGYTVFFLTGRPASQLAGTEANLTDAGYAYDDSNIYLKDQTKPWLSECAPDCTTIEYKSLTRKYIESQGYDIVANFGDQFSDLKGGYADKTFKMPNPMYYLP